jgi:hemerythrin
MPIVTWDDSLATGDPVVDLQHRTLIAMVDGIHDAISGGEDRHRLQRRLEELTTYALEHFTAEEHLMARSGYPDADTHAQRHRDLARQAEDILDGYRTGRLVITLTLPQFLADWVRHHIAGEDQGMIAWIRARRG